LIAAPPKRAVASKATASDFIGIPLSSVSNCDGNAQHSSRSADTNNRGIKIRRLRHCNEEISGYLIFTRWRGDGSTHRRKLRNMSADAIVVPSNQPPLQRSIGAF
jgi:hypothetical protein